MEKLLSMWEKVKGKIALGAVTLLISIPAVGGYLGLQVVEDSPENQVCIELVEETDVIPSE